MCGVQEVQDGNRLTASRTLDALVSTEKIGKGVAREGRTLPRT